MPVTARRPLSGIIRGRVKVGQLTIGERKLIAAQQLEILNGREKSVAILGAKFSAKRSAARRGPYDAFRAGVRSRSCQ